MEGSIDLPDVIPASASALIQPAIDVALAAATTAAEQQAAQAGAGAADLQLSFDASTMKINYKADVPPRSRSPSTSFPRPVTFLGSATTCQALSLSPL